MIASVQLSKARASAAAAFDALVHKDKELEMPTSPRAKPVDVQWAIDFGNYTKALGEANRENYLDFYVKYEGKTPTQRLGEQRYQWCLIFKLIEKEEGGPLMLPDECVELLQRFQKAGMTMDVAQSSDEKEVIVELGCSYEVMIEEANEMKPLMRLKNTLGSTEFSSEHIDYFAINRFQTVPMVFTSGLRQRIVWNRMCRVAKVNLQGRHAYLLGFCLLLCANMHVSLYS